MSGVQLIEKALGFLLYLTERMRMIIEAKGVYMCMTADERFVKSFYLMVRGLVQSK